MKIKNRSFSLVMDSLIGCHDTISSDKSALISKLLSSFDYSTNSYNKMQISLYYLSCEIPRQLICADILDIRLPSFALLRSIWIQSKVTSPFLLHKDGG